MKKESISVNYLMPFVTIIVALVVSYLVLPFNIDSIYDEGALFYMVRGAADGTIEGISQWHNMLYSILGDDICSSVLTLRTTGYVLKLITAVVFWLLTQTVVNNIKGKVVYLLLVLFMLVPCIEDIIICYNGISQFLLIVACGTLYRLFTDKKIMYIVFEAFLTSLLLTLSVFSILPSAVLISFAVLVLVLIRFWKEWRNLLACMSAALIGVACGLLVMHLFVSDLSVVIDKMVETSQSITTVDRGYDPISFVVKTILFLRDMTLCLLFITGIYYICNRVKIRFAWPIASVLYVLFLFMYGYYQSKPKLTIAMLMAVLWYQPLLEKSAAQHIASISFESIFKLFLIFFPLLASIGTNVYLGGKMAYFLIPWALLYAMLVEDEKYVQFRTEALIVLSCMLLIAQYRSYRSIDYSQTKILDGSLTGMYMKPAQEEHFNKVDSILLQYNYKRGKSVFFTTQLSTMTTLYLDGKIVGNFFQPMDFVACAKENLLTPDFLFLCKFDEDIAGEALRNMNWGWPNEFDKYYIGTPETLDTGYSTRRWLYCRRIK